MERSDRQRPKIEEIFKEADEITESVRCVNGANEQHLPIIGKTVGWARNALTDSLNIAPGALALLDGEKAADDVVLVHGQTLEFLRVRRPD